VYSTNRGFKMKSIISLLILVSLSACTIVGPGRRGISITLGTASDEVKSEGIYLWVPFIRSVKKMNVQIQKAETESESASKDMQKVIAKVATNWSIEPVKVVNIYKTIGDEEDIELRVIDPTVNEVMKAATAKLTAEEILTKRMQLKHDIDELVRERLSKYGVIVHDVSLVNMTFTEKFNHAVESKQVAEQESKQAQYEAEKLTVQAKGRIAIARADAESKILEAKAEAEANKMKQSTITPNLIRFELIKRWNGKLPTVSGGGSGTFLNIKLPEEEQNESE
jgi:regulator of protease activity HflC (stomatin/prohibitin superfamily)